MNTLKIDDYYCTDIACIDFQKEQLARIDQAIELLSGYVDIPVELANKKFLLNNSLYESYREKIFKSE